MDISIANLAGETLCTFSLPMHWKVECLKCQIHDAIKLPPLQQRLCIGDTIARSQQPLAEFLMPNFDSLEFILIRRDAQLVQNLDTSLDWIILSEIRPVPWEHFGLAACPVKNAHACLAQADDELVEYAVRRCPELFAGLDEASQQHMQVAVAFLESLTAWQSQTSLWQIPSGLWSDRAFVLAAAESNMINKSNLLEYVSADLLVDRHVVMTLLEGSVGSFGAEVSEIQWLKNLTKNWMSDREVVKAAVQLHGPVLQAASPELRADREVVLAAVTAPQHVHRYRRKVDYEVLALRYASKELLADHHIVGAAVQTEGMALKFASKHLRATQDLVFMAASQRTRAFKYASDKLRSDHNLILRLVRQRPEIVQFWSPTCWADDDLLFEVLLRAPDTAFLMSRRPSVILDVIDSHPLLLDTTRIKEKALGQQYNHVHSWEPRWLKLFGRNITEDWGRKFKESISEAEMWMADVYGFCEEEERDFIEEVQAEKKRGKRWRQVRFSRR
mmetsp:Transcript_93141/g.170771  ORF Transcript_93141/g.170771 Transcript_93141/m.170771 type:complete len:502 (+) Transcript_93141:66-1571(+)